MLSKMHTNNLNIHGSAEAKHGSSIQETIVTASEWALRNSHCPRASLYIHLLNYVLTAAKSWHHRGNPYEVMILTASA